MKLKEVDKKLYRQTLNKVIITFVVTFALLAVVFGSVLISLLAEPIIDPQTQSNLKYNVAGVVLALLFMSMLLNKYKRHEYLTDVYYVWQLKQIHNQIYRKLKKIKAAAQRNDANALIILAFYYKTLQQVYQLDDNTLTIKSVEKEIAKLKETLAPLDFDEQVNKFNQDLIKEI